MAEFGLPSLDLPGFADYAQKAASIGGIFGAPVMGPMSVALGYINQGERDKALGYHKPSIPGRAARSLIPSFMQRDVLGTLGQLGPYQQALYDDAPLAQRQQGAKQTQYMHMYTPEERELMSESELGWDYDIADPDPATSVADVEGVAGVTMDSNEHYHDDPLDEAAEEAAEADEEAGFGEDSGWARGGLVDEDMWNGVGSLMNQRMLELANGGPIDKQFLFDERPDRDYSFGILPFSKRKAIDIDELSTDPNIEFDPAAGILGFMGRGVAAPQRVIEGEISPMEGAWQAAMAVPIGGMSSRLFPVKGPGMVAGMFAGKEAKTADLKKLAQAEKMAERGHSREEIWDQTGWFRWMRDGEPVSPWKFEISDLGSAAIFNPRVQTPTGRIKAAAKPVISDLLKHPELYKAFPGAGPGPAPAHTMLKSIEEQRAVLAMKLKELKASKKDANEYGAELQKLEEQDMALLQQYIKVKNAGQPVSPAVSSESPYSWGREALAQAEKESKPPFLTEWDLYKRPMQDIKLETMPSKIWGVADYLARADRIRAKRRPGQPLSKHLQKIPWDEKGRYVQPFSPSQARAHYKRLAHLLEKEGISLDTKHRGQYWSDVHTLRKGTEPIDPKDLPSSPLRAGRNLKRAWDHLIAGGIIYYKKNYDRGELFRSDATHELQHAIQHRTPGFESGANRQEFLKTLVKDREGKKLSATEIYLRILGEMEARLADTRRNLTDKQRGKLYPWTKEGGLDRPESDLLLRSDFGTGGFVDKPLYDQPRMIG